MEARQEMTTPGGAQPNLVNLAKTVLADPGAGPSPTEVVLAPTRDVPPQPQDVPPAEDVSPPAQDVSPPAEDVPRPPEDVPPPAEDISPPAGDVSPPAEPEPAATEPEPVAAEAAPVNAEAVPVSAEDGQTAEPGSYPSLPAIADLGARIDGLAETTAELARLRTRDTDLITRLHDDVTRLRNGEIAIALNPVVTGIIKLHDQMVSLGALNDPASPVGLLHTQLLQVLELTCAVKPFTPAAGERFDAARHTGMRRVPVTDPAADGTIASTIRAGFARADGSVVRVAEVEVNRLAG